MIFDFNSIIYVFIFVSALFIGFIIGGHDTRKVLGKILDGYRLKYGFDREIEITNIEKRKDKDEILIKRKKFFEERIQKDRERAGYT